MNTAPDAGDAHHQGGSALGPAAFLIVTVIVLYTLPVQIAIHAPISGLIYGFALWEAWKITTGFRISFNGPFRVSPS